jgi:hypothetical protein
MSTLTNGHFFEMSATRVALLLTDVTSERDGQGDILWSGGPGQDSEGHVRGAHSYYCIYGKSPSEAAEMIKNIPSRKAAETVKAVGARDTPPTTKIACGQYYNNEEQGPFDLFADGHYENLATGTSMSSVRVDSCGICIVFRYVMIRILSYILREAWANNITAGDVTLKATLCGLVDPANMPVSPSRVARAITASTANTQA